MMVTSKLYNTTELTEVIGSDGIDNILKDLYIDKSQLEYQRKRYINALNRFTQLYGEGDVLIFSAREEVRLAVTTQTTRMEKFLRLLLIWILLQ